MEPATKIITTLGGASAVASITGVHRTRVYSWMRSKEAGGTGGTIPQRHHVTLLDAARKRGVDLHADDFLASAAELIGETLPPNPPEVSESSSEISAFCSEVSEPSPKHAEGDS